MGAAALAVASATALGLLVGPWRGESFCGGCQSHDAVLRRRTARLRSVSAAASATGAEEGSGGNPWRDDPSAALEAALGRANTEWSILRAQAEVQEERGQKGRAATEELARCAAELLSSSAVDRLRPFVVPAEYIDIPPLRGGDEAVVSLLGGEGAQLVFNFLSETRSPSQAVRVFWQSELYLRSIQETPGEAPVEDAVREAGEELEAKDDEFRAVLRGSVILARQNFISAARFGYFLRRSRQRWELERGMGALASASDDDEDGDDFVKALQRKAREVSGGASGSMYGRQEQPLDFYIGRLPAEQAVELVRVATEEATLAIELRATALYGSERSLLEPLDRNDLSNVLQLQLSQEARLRLSIEAAAFGAALFEAEEAGARSYELSYTAFGSRSPPAER